MIIAWTNFPFCPLPLPSPPASSRYRFFFLLFLYFHLSLFICVHGHPHYTLISCPSSFFLLLSFALLLMAATLAFSLAAAAAAAQGQRLIASPTGQMMAPQGLRPPTSGGGQIMNLIRSPQMAAMMTNGAPTLVPPSPDGGLIYTTPYDYPYALAPTSLLEYPIEHSGVLGKRAWGSMGPAGAMANFGQLGQEGGLFYPGAGVLDMAAMSHNQDMLKGKYVVST